MILDNMLINSIFPISNGNYSDSFKERMAELTKKSQANFLGKKVVILGAGPAGLIRGIESILQGHQTTILEIREHSDKNRDNTVGLQKNCVIILKKYGIYQYLIEKHLILNPSEDERIAVRLCDLEEAMKSVLQKLSHKPVIQYESQVKKITCGEKSGLEIESKLEGLYSIHDVDFIINAEGAKGSTNALLNIKRIQVLPKMPVIAAIFQDNRPKISNLISFAEYVLKTISSTIMSTYHYTVFFFWLFRNVTNLKKNIPTSLILKTPHQNYLGYGFNKVDMEAVKNLQKNVKEKNHELIKAKQENKSEFVIKQIQKDIEDAQEKMDAFLKYRINIAFCAINVFYNFFPSNPYFINAPRYPLINYHLVEVGADKASVIAKKIGKTVFLNTGDSLVTVDPSTGLGCTTAILSVKHTKKVLKNSSKTDLIISEYIKNSKKMIEFIHNESKIIRFAHFPYAYQ